MDQKRKKGYRRVRFLFFLTFVLFVGGCAGAGENQPKAKEASAVDSKQPAQEGSASPGLTDAPEAAGDAESGDEKRDSGQNSGEAEANAASAAVQKNSVQGELKVEFLDVGQGSAALVSQNGRYMLIDGGDRDYSSFVVSSLKEQGVEKLDYVVVSHYDADHLNGVVGVLNALECAQVLAPDYEEDTKVYQSFQKVMEEKKIPLEHPALGNEYAFAEGSFRVVSPVSYEYEDANANSIGIRLAYGENSFLICGDCTEESEQDLLYAGVEVKSDVYAASHHGSKYSSSEEFLKAVKPDSVVVSCGKGNSYGHPHAQALKRIQDLGADLYRTDLQGTVTAVSDGKTVRFENEVCMDYRSGAEIGEGGAAEGNDSGNTAGGSDAAGRTEADTAAAGQAEDPPAAENGTEEAKDYVLNQNTKKIHLPGCSSVEEMNESNRQPVHDTKENLLEAGYSPCKRCNP